MFRILSGILTIGNLEFSIDDEGFTRQNFIEEKIQNNLSIIAVYSFLFFFNRENSIEVFFSCRICLV